MAVTASTLSWETAEDGLIRFLLKLDDMFGVFDFGEDEAVGIPLKDWLDLSDGTWPQNDSEL